MKFLLSILSLLAVLPAIFGAQEWEVLVGGDSGIQDSIQPTTAWIMANFYPSQLEVSAGDTVHFAFKSIEQFTVTWTNNTRDVFINPAGEFSNYANNVSIPANNTVVFDGSFNFSTGYHTNSDSDLYVTAIAPGFYIFYDLIHFNMTFILTVNEANSASATTPAEISNQAWTQLASDRANLVAATSTLSVFTTINDPTTLNQTFGRNYTDINVNQGTGIVGFPSAPFSSGFLLGAPGIKESEPSFGISCQTTEYQNLRTAAPKTWTVYSGLFYAQTNSYSARFYPSLLTINVNDTVNFDVSFDYYMPHIIVFNNTGFVQSQSLYTNSTENDGKVMFKPVFSTPSPLTERAVNGTGFFSSGQLQFPQSKGTIFNFEFTFTAPGVYRYADVLHENNGMFGFIQVLPESAQSC